MAHLARRVYIEVSDARLAMSVVTLAVSIALVSMSLARVDFSWVTALAILSRYQCPGMRSAGSEVVPKVWAPLKGSVVSAASIWHLHVMCGVCCHGNGQQLLFGHWEPGSGKLVLGFLEHVYVLQCALV